MKRWSVLLVLLLCVSWAPHVSAKTTFRYSNFFPPTHIQSQLTESWCKEVEKRTNGEVVIQYFPASTLTKADQTYGEVVSGGIADIGMSALGYSRGRFPVAEAIDLPMGYTSGVQATAVANAMYEKFKPEEFNDTHILFFHAHGPGLIHTRDKEINTLEDLKGLKIRSTGTSGLVMDALGASPVGTSMRECYPMLQKGVVDGSCHPIESNKGWKLGEVVHYMIQNFSTAYTTTFGVFMNKNQWSKLTPEQQNAIMEINREWAVKHAEAWDESDKEGMAFFKEKGGIVIPQSADEAEKWRQAALPVLDNYIKKVSEKGVDGKAVVDFIKANM
ncbi:MAG: TRAP transporter substrate-binding protein [Desulfobacter postgatei]|uniref:TRAP transporter substrate-binding protein n=1 Tax=Desulfobacter postgatei TaxID=2293 RepID=UPI0023F00F06|nr:TRAP transporter substrate-binding protein [Desulfobacter postgatei]MDD4275202.1 TRAP transporter substrate-binding protein [Desulfobacter postgatei]